MRTVIRLEKLKRKDNSEDLGVDDGLYYTGS